MTVVSDSSPIISLAKIQSFQLLRELFGVITITGEVHDELVAGGAGRPGASETVDSDWVRVKRVKFPTEVAAAQARFGLGAGEISTLILAKETRADLVLIDDLGARKLARREGLHIAGTIGVLEAGFRNGYLSDLREAYVGLLSRGVHLHRNLINRSLESFRLAPL